MPLIIYVILGYLAVPHTIWKGKIVIGYDLFTQRLIWGALLGWFIIPWWFLGMMFSKK